MAKAIDFVTYDPFAAAAQIKADKEAAQSTSLSLVRPVETPEIEKSSNLANEQTSEQENELMSLLDEESDDLQENELTSKQVNEQNSKRVNAKTRKLDNKKTISRNWQIGLKIQEKHGKMLKRYAFLNDLFLVDVLEQAIENLVNLKSSKIATPYNERAHQEIDDQEIDKIIDDNHHRIVCQAYRRLTKNLWMPDDEKDYHRIKHFSSEQIEYAMKKIKPRAKQEIGKFGYFVTGMANEIAKMKPMPAAPSAESDYRRYVLMFIGFADAEEGKSVENRMEYIKLCCKAEEIKYDEELAQRIATDPN